ncbi:hypothetical protein H9L39_17604 [Fusarium oxysporum f. sp. albedinis]|nr:hypothetical protein H9L39_17604 [Fusarium oxysporum f. sp. albedinis]
MPLSRKQPEVVDESLLRRAEITKMVRRLQTRLSLAHLKTKYGWEDLPLDSVEAKVKKTRRNPLYDGDILSDHSSDASDMPHSIRTFSSLPLIAPLSSNTISLSNVVSGQRKRKSLCHTMSSGNNKRFRASSTAQTPFSGHSVWRNSLQSTQLSFIERGRLSHATASAYPAISHAKPTFMDDAGKLSDFVARSNKSNNLRAPSHGVNRTCCSTPRTPSTRTQTLDIKRNREDSNVAIKGKTGEDAPGTPQQDFDFADFVSLSPSPMQAEG